MTKTEKKIVKQIEESLSNFEGVKLSNKLKAESIYLLVIDSVKDDFVELLSEEISKRFGNIL